MKSDRLTDRVEPAQAFSLLGGGLVPVKGNDTPASTGSQLHRPRRISSADLARLAASLTDQDRAVLDSVVRLRVLTAGQLNRLHFAALPSGERQARRLLNRLVTRRVLTRLDRRIGGIKGGSAGFVYAADTAGRRLCQVPGAARSPWTPGAAYLAHALLISEVYVRLAEACRRGEAELLGFAVEAAAARRFHGLGGALVVVRPDFFARLGQGEDELLWFGEVDCATEGTGAIARKCEVYRRYWQSGREQAAWGAFPCVLWIVPSEQRRAVVIEVIARQPAEAWGLFRVVTFDQAMTVLTGGQP